MFSSKFPVTFKNTYFVENMQTTTSDSYLVQCDKSQILFSWHEQNITDFKIS